MEIKQCNALQFSDAEKNDWNYGINEHKIKSVCVELELFFLSVEEQEGKKTHTYLGP